MATSNKTLIITTPQFYRTIDLTTHAYHHQVRQKKGEGDVIGEFVYPQGRTIVSRIEQKGENRENILISNQIMTNLPKTKRKLKRPLLHLEHDKLEDRFYEDGSIFHGTASMGGLCKIQCINKDDSGQELTVSFTITIPASQAGEGTNKKH